MRNWLFGAALIVALAALTFAASPWPSVLVIRTIFDSGAEAASRKLASRVPNAVSTTTHRYDMADPAALLDIHRPASSTGNVPVIVWIHGGGFVSGRRKDITNYAKILAGEGFVVVNLEYAIAPEATYPGPVRQVLLALAYLDREGSALGLPSSRFVLAGDSAGAQIAAQTAAVLSNPAYAQQIGLVPALGPQRIAGALLFCGVYDIGSLGESGGVLGWFVNSAGWAYSGRRDWRSDPHFRTMSISSHVTRDFPPAFISAGNADPLSPQSVRLAKDLEATGVPVETLFFTDDHKPPLGHEFQFDLGTAAGRLALERSTNWLRRLPR